ncbi:Ppid [Symbiodinium microadriaticum]|nr:Ppid [Symbiodinium microadriaticum]
MRMTIVQDVVTTLVGKTIALGAKLDDGSIAVGAALLAREALAVKPPPVSPASNVVDDDAVTTEESPTPAAEPEETFGLTVDELVAARAMEIAMQARDEEVRTLQACRNQMESYILDMRGAPNRKHGETIDREALNNLLNDFENWLWDNGETASLQGIQDKFAALRSAVEGDVRAVASEGDDSQATQREGGLCSAYIAATEADRLRVEENLAAEAALAAQQKAEDGEDEDHDFRKLKKADRMRLVVKNKEEGTELFKGGNIRPAAARYQKALTHAAKFFDLSPEDIEEVNQVKLSIFLNLAQCYLKLENWENAIRYSTDALGISSTSSKAYFRRAAAYEAKKDYDKALEDLKLASQHAPEDKAILKSVERVKRFIQKEKEKEKKMWGKAFS